MSSKSSGNDRGDGQEWPPRWALTALPVGLDERFLSRPQLGVPMFAEGAVPVVAASFSQRPDRLWVPTASVRAPAPIDQIATFLTGQQLFGHPIPLSVVVAHLRRMPLEDVLELCASLLHGLDSPEHGQAAVDRWFLDTLGPIGSAGRRARSRLEAGGAVLVAPQVAMMLMKLAAKICGDTLMPGVQQGMVGMAWYGTADALQRLDRKEQAQDEADLVVGTGTPGVVEREVVASHHFHLQRELPHTMGMFVRRWLQLPAELAGHPRVVDLPAEFAAAMGVTLEQWITVGVAVHAAVTAHGPHLPVEFAAALRLPGDVVERILTHVMRPVPALRGWVLGEVNEGGLQAWEFSHLEQFPLIELDGGDVLVARPALVLQRFFGWLPAFDLERGLQAAGASNARRRRAIGALEHLGEVCATETLAAQADRHRLRRFDGDQLQTALAPVRGGKRRKTCDASLDDGRRWALFEMTSSRLARAAANATSAQRLEADLEKLVEKIEQLDSTIEALRENEDSLTGAGAAGDSTFGEGARGGGGARAKRRRYLPALILTEGFPINPVTLVALRQRAAERGLLQGQDVAPLEVLDVGELEMLEGAELGEPSVLDALTTKASSSLALASVRDHLLVERRINARVPERIEALWLRAFEIARRHLDADAA